MISRQVSLGHQIKRLRGLKGVSLERLSRLTGISETNLTAIEQDETLPTPLQLRQMSLVLGEDGCFSQMNAMAKSQETVNQLSEANIVSFEKMKKRNTHPMCVYVVEKDPIERLLIVTAVKKYSNLVYDFGLQEGLAIVSEICREDGGDLSIPAPDMILVTPEQFDEHHYKHDIKLDKNIQVYAFTSNKGAVPCPRLKRAGSVISLYEKPLTVSDMQFCVEKIIKKATKIMTG